MNTAPATAAHSPLTGYTRQHGIGVTEAIVAFGRGGQGRAARRVGLRLLRCPLPHVGRRAKRS